MTDKLDKKYLKILLGGSVEEASIGKGFRLAVGQTLTDDELKILQEKANDPRNIRLDDGECLLSCNDQPGRLTVSLDENNKVTELRYG